MDGRLLDRSLSKFNKAVDKLREDLLGFNQESIYKGLPSNRELYDLIQEMLNAEVQANGNQSNSTSILGARQQMLHNILDRIEEMKES